MLLSGHVCLHVRVNRGGAGMIHIPRHCKAVSCRAEVLSLPHSSGDEDKRPQLLEQSPCPAPLLVLSIMRLGSHSCNLLGCQSWLQRACQARGRHKALGHRDSTPPQPQGPSGHTRLGPLQLAECPVLSTRHLSTLKAPQAKVWLVQLETN